MTYIFYGLGVVFCAGFCASLFWEWWQDHRDL